MAQSMIRPIVRGPQRPGLRLTLQELAQCEEIHQHLDCLTLTQVAKMALSAGLAQLIGQYLAAKQSERPNG